MAGPENTFGDNLRAARLTRGWSLEKLASEAETSKGYLSSLETGKRPMPPGRKLERFAEALGVTVGQLAGRAARVIPVISWVSAGRLVDPAYQLAADLESVEISGLEAGDYFATRVSGDSMDRVSPDGSMILVNRLEREPIRGRRYIFAKRGETTYKRFDTNPLRLVPESTNPFNEPLFPDSEDEWEVIGRVRMSLLSL